MTTAVRKPSPATIRRQLEKAAGLLDGRPAAKDARAAHALAVKAAASLDQLVQWHALQDADGHRQYAIKTAKTTRDARGYRRGPVTMPGYHLGRQSPVKGRRYPPTPPTVNDVLKMLAAAPSVQMANQGECASCGAGRRIRERHAVECCNPHGERMRAALLLLWRGGFRVGCELLRLRVDDLHPEHGYVQVRYGKHDKTGRDKPREVVIDDWAWPMLEPWLAFRATMPGDLLFCVITGATAGREWTASSLRRQLHRLAAHAGVRTRVAPHQLRHALACEQIVEGIPELYVSRNLGHADLRVTSQYLRGLPQGKVREALRARPMPQISMQDALRNEGVQMSRSSRTPDLMGALARRERELLRS